MLCNRNELVGQNDAAGGMHPADQSFGARHFSPLHLRLIVEHELFCLDRQAQILLQHRLGIYDSLQGGREEAQGVAPVRLGQMQGNIGFLKDLAGCVLSIPEDCNAHAGCREALAVIEQTGLANGSQDLLAHGLGLGCRFLGDFTQFVEDDDKLVAAQPAHGVGFVRTGGDAPGDLLEQKIAGVMAERIVERFEVIDIDQQQRFQPATLSAVRQGLAQSLKQQPAVGQTGQRVVQRESVNRALGRLGAGDIPDRRDDAGGARNLDNRCRDQHPDLLPVFLHKFGLEVTEARFPAQQFNDLRSRPRICPDAKFGRGSSYNLFGGDADQIEKCLVDVDVTAVTQTAERDAIETGVKDSAVAFFARQQSRGGRCEALFCRLDLGDLFCKSQPARLAFDLYQG